LNGPPLAFNDAYITPQGNTLNVPAGLGVLANDLDPESDPLAAVLVDDVPAGLGTLVLSADGSFTYVPPSPEFTGVVTFTYMATDFTQTSNVNTVTLTVPSTAGAYVAARQLFYNDSLLDGNSPGSDPRDDQAIAPDKVALLPGSTASFLNYSSYSRGLNGVIVDVQGLADPVGLSAADFTFRTGNDATPATWAAAPAPASLSVRPGAGTGGADRITLTWPDGAITTGWLQVTVTASPATGLSQDDVFYFGNAIGETGDNPADTVVDDQDLQLTMANQRGPFAPAGPTDPFDFNRDQLVNATDIILARDHATNPFTALHLLTLAAGTAASAAASYAPAAGSSAAVVAAAPSVAEAQNLAEPAWHTAPTEAMITAQSDRPVQATGLQTPPAQDVPKDRDALFGDLSRAPRPPLKRLLRPHRAAAAGPHEHAGPRHGLNERELEAVWVDGAALHSAALHSAALDTAALHSAALDGAALYGAKAWTRVHGAFRP